MGPAGPVVTIKGIEFTDILAYMDKFPVDVDDERFFIRMIQALDREFLTNGSRQSQTRSSS